MKWAISWALYWLGDLVSKWNDDDRRFTEFGFNTYQRLMATSIRVQGDTDQGPWRPVR